MKISVIIVNFNTQKLLKDCLSSLFEKNKKVKMEVIVVDNASSDGSAEMVERFFPKLILIENKKNLGFAAGNNVGLKSASGEYLLLLNSDTQFLENSLEQMIDFMDNHPSVGISSCQLVGGDGQIQPSGGFFPNLPRIFAWMFFLDDLPFIGGRLKPFHPHSPKFYTRDRWYLDEHFQDWVTGAFFLMRRQVLAQIGLLDENFFMYVEEMEYCYRAKRAGWQVVYTPRTKILHLGGQSGSSKRALTSEYQGLKYFFAKHHPAWQRFVLKIFLKGGAILRIILFGIIEGNKSRKEAYVEAFRLA